MPPEAAPNRGPSSWPRFEETVNAWACGGNVSRETLFRRILFARTQLGQVDLRGMWIVSRISSSLSSRLHWASTPAERIRSRLRVMVLRNRRTSFTIKVGFFRAGRGCSSRIPSARASVWETVSFWSTTCRAAANCCSGVSRRSRARAWRSVAPPSRRIVKTSGYSLRRRSLLATADWLLPMRRAASS